MKFYVVYGVVFDIRIHERYADGPGFSLLFVWPLLNIENHKSSISFMDIELRRTTIFATLTMVLVLDLYFIFFEPNNTQLCGTVGFSLTCLYYRLATDRTNKQMDLSRFI